MATERDDEDSDGQGLTPFMSCHARMVWSLCSSANSVR